MLKTPFLAACRGVGIYLLYNGILGDRSEEGGNILTRAVLAQLPPFDGQKVIYCAGHSLGPTACRPSASSSARPPTRSSVMIILKDYQVRVLDSLRDFFRQCSREGQPEAAYQAIQVRNGQPPVPYLPVSVAGLAQGCPTSACACPPAAARRCSPATPPAWP